MVSQPLRRPEWEDAEALWPIACRYFTYAELAELTLKLTQDIDAGRRPWIPPAKFLSELIEAARRQCERPN